MELSQYSKDVLLRDGTPAHLRAIRPDDKQRLIDAFSRASGASLYARFLSKKKALSNQELKYLTEIDYIHHMAIGLEVNEGPNCKPIAIARYVEFTDKEGSGRVAEIAFIVDERYKNLGAATLLFDQLVFIAQKSGITKLVADVLQTNRAMLHILQRSGYALRTAVQDDVMHIEFDIA